MVRHVDAEKDQVRSFRHSHALFFQTESESIHLPRQENVIIQFDPDDNSFDFAKILYGQPHEAYRKELCKGNVQRKDSQNAASHWGPLYLARCVEEKKEREAKKERELAEALESVGKGGYNWGIFHSCGYPDTSMKVGWQARSACKETEGLLDESLTQNEVLAREVEEGQRRWSEEQRLKMCIVCTERERELVVQPCGHADMCRPCAKRLFEDPQRKCPVCRVHITSAKRFRLS